MGGRGLPSDLSQAVVRDGRFVTSPLEGPIEELLRILERREAAAPVSGAAAGLQNTVIQKGGRALEGEAARLEKLARDPRPEVRRTALWGLARTGRYEVVPVLIDALRDPDPGCAREARRALRTMSRKPDGFGLPETLDAKQLEQEIEKWTEWYWSVRPYDELAEP